MTGFLLSFDFLEQILFLPDGAAKKSERNTVKLIVLLLIIRMQ